MSKIKKNLNIFSTIGCLAIVFLLSACSNKKNTAFSRFYHSFNTRYNVHFNANEAYKESFDNKQHSQDEDENLTKILQIYPEILDSADLKFQGSFTTTIDKTTKAIKLHSITTRPRRDPNKRVDAEYRQWLNQKEFNPFLINSWMLLAKAEFEEGNYLRAITTFMHISKIYVQDKRIVSESKLWIARAYSEMGWKYEAENVLRKMEQNDEIHHQLLGMYASIKANIHVRNKNYESAIPYLEESIKKEKNKNQKRRKRYLLGQLYAQTGENEKAYRAFGAARDFSAPYKYTISSKLSQIAISNQSQKEIISSLNKLTKGKKNEDYLDQVYTALGDVYLNDLDTTNAIKNYSLAVEKSKREAYDKALAEVKLGALHFAQQEYIKAQPHYSGALSRLRKDDEHFPIVSLRSEVLDQLVVHAKVVHEQDSLLLLANMPEVDRLEVINKHIEKLKKEEKEKEREKQKQEQIIENEITGWDDIADWGAAAALPAANQQEASDFYFYNEQTVTQGKITFQKQWGRRSLEDNWRRKNKTSSNPFGEELLAEEAEEDKKESETQEEGKEESKEEQTDQYSVEYYLQQLPFSEEAKEAAYKLIENGLFNMGLIYKNLLEDYSLATKTFETTLNRFPATQHREEIYFQLFMIYLKVDNLELAANYRNHIISEFPESKYTIPLQDINYVWNFRYMSKKQEELYQATYEAYLAGDVRTVRNNYEEIQTKFPFVDLMPKFAFLNSLSYAQTKDAKNLEATLTKLIADHPQSDVTPLATNILKNIKDGKIILSDGTPITSIDWTMAYSNDSIFEGEGAKALEYLTDLDKPYVLLLMFKPNSIDRNDLLYEVADYNFSNYVIQTYDLSFDPNEILSSLQINGFQDFKAIKAYLNKAMQEEGLLTKLDENIIPMPISTTNYSTIYPRLGLENYMTFYADSLATETPLLLSYWNKEHDDRLAAIDKEEEQKDKTATDEKDKDIAETIIPETGEEKIKHPVAPQQKEDKETEKENDDKEINLDDVLSKEQLATLGAIDKKSDDIVEAISNLGSNPVEGLKSIFNRNKLEDNLTKEEKEELKQEQKEEKARQKELVKIEKAKQDSIKQIERLRLDSIKQVEQAVQDSIKTAKRQEIERIKTEKEAKDHLQKEKEKERKRLLKEKEDSRKTQLKEREERRKEQEKERNEKLRQREREREELIKRREEERKAKEQEAEQLRKQREQERNARKAKR